MGILNKLVDTTEYQRALRAINEIDEMAKNIDHDLNKVYQASEFDRNMLGNMIVDLMSAVNGDRFVFINRYFEREDSEENRTVGYIADMVVREEAADKRTEPQTLVENGQGVLLGIHNTQGKERCHLLEDSTASEFVKNGGQFKWVPYFGGYYFVRNFLEEVIEYKYSNGISEISPEELRKLIESFVSRIGIRQYTIL